MIQVKSYPLSKDCNLVVTRPRFYDVKYTQVYIKCNNIQPNGSIIDLPVSPPLDKSFQIFQVHMVCESAKAEYSLHTKPYLKCSMTDWLFKHTTTEKDEMLNEVWIVKPDNICVPPYLYFSFKELSGSNPGKVSFEVRLTN